MPPIRLDHIAIALPRIADAPAAVVAVPGGVPDRPMPSLESASALLGIPLRLRSF